MAKYVRLVFEEEIQEGTTSEEIVDKMEGYIENYIKNGVSIDDIEISESSYMRDGERSLWCEISSCNIIR